MLVVHVHITVKPECVAPFREATIANARESLKEPGIARFDFMQQSDAPDKFVIVEATRMRRPDTRRPATIKPGGTRLRP